MDSNSQKPSQEAVDRAVNRMIDEVTSAKVTRKTSLKLLKSTGNTHVYQEEGHERHKQVFPTIYVQKHNFGMTAEPPDTIEVTMSWEAQS